MRFMKIKIFAFILMLLGGCSEIQNQESESDKTTVLKEITLISLEQNCLVEIGKNMPITQTIEEINKNFIVTPKLSHNGTVCECTSVNKEFPEDKCYVKCHYLGRWNGQHVIFRYYLTGGSGHFTDILLCSINKDMLRINKVCCVGDRAFDGITEYPILKGSRIYFKMYLSIYSLASLSKIDEKKVSHSLSQGSQDFWNISDCVYDLKNDELHLLSISVNPTDEYSADINKIIKIMIPNANDCPIRIDHDHIADFLRKFKTAYLSI